MTSAEIMAEIDRYVKEDAPLDHGERIALEELAAHMREWLKQREQEKSDESG